MLNLPRRTGVNEPFGSGIPGTMISIFTACLFGGCSYFQTFFYGFTLGLRIETDDVACPRPRKIGNKPHPRMLKCSIR
jgi:hypothetical protein